jgi:hypothetical protein
LFNKNVRCAAAKKAAVRCARSQIFSPMSELRGDFNGSTQHFNL